MSAGSVARAPYWSAADQAELDAIIWDVVCALEGIPEGDPRRETIIELMLDWWRRRHLVSKAEWLRRRHLYARLAEIEEIGASREPAAA